MSLLQQQPHIPMQNSAELPNSTKAHPGYCIESS
jgi:hypothetical protein